MPIRATSDQGDIHAFALDASQWATLKGNYRSMNLQMPCCGVAAIPKTSSRDNYFFAHERRGECSTADESPEHLYCKSIIAKAAHEAGWAVTTERPGTTPDGQEWVADVFCERGSAKLALEVQMSSQADAETIRRQANYRASGVRGAWFFGARARRGDTDLGREIPAFILRPIVLGELPTLELFNVNLAEFVTAMLQKRLSWRVPRFSRPHLVEYFLDMCWACKNPVKQVIEHLHGDTAPEGQGFQPGDFYEGRWIPTAHTVANLSNLCQAVQDDITNDELTAQGLNPIGRCDVINGKPTRFPFCNLCIHCGAPQNNFHLSERIQASKQRWRAASQDDSPFGLTEIQNEEDVTDGFGVVAIPREVDTKGAWMLDGGPTATAP